MKYKNASDILPIELLTQLQNYTQGEYLYIPVAQKRISEAPTGYQTELKKRNSHIYTLHLEGLNNNELSGIYHLSESSIRRILADGHRKNIQRKKQVTHIINQWNLRADKIRQIHDSAWQIDDSYVLKVYQDLELLLRNVEILRILDSKGIPVSRIIPAPTQEMYVEYEGLYFLLSQKLQGSNLLVLGKDTNLSFRMGEIIARLHTAFLECEKEAHFWDNSLLDEMNGWVKTSFEKNSWKLLRSSTYNELLSELSAIYDSLPVQLIHRDVHFGNFLFDNGNFSGYIDFDLSQRNIRIFDLCYFTLGLLSEKEKRRITEDFWLEHVRKVFAGYEQTHPLSAAEKKAVPLVMQCIELLFAAYYESINDQHCAQDACRIYELIKGWKTQIWQSI